jgi:hypothetical protein
MFRRAVLTIRHRRSFIRTFATEQKKDSNIITTIQKQWQKYAAVITSIGYGALNLYYSIDQYREIPRVVDAVEKGTRDTEAALDSKVVREHDLIERPKEVDQVKDLIQVGSHHETLIGVLSGQPGTGKSTIARQAIEQSESKRVIVIRFDAGIVQGEKGIVQQIATAVNYTPFVPTEAKTNFSYWLNKISFSHKRREPSLLEMFHVLERICLEMKKEKRPLFIFDNVEATWQGDDRYIKNLMGFAARGVIQDAWSVLFIVDDGPASNALYTNNLAHHLTANGVYVGNVDDEEGKEYFMKTVNDIRKRRSIDPLSQEQVNELVEKVTGGHVATIRRIIRDVQMLKDSEKVEDFVNNQIESARPQFGVYGEDRCDIDYRSRGLWKMLFKLVESKGNMSRDDAWRIIVSELYADKSFKSIPVDNQLKLQQTADELIQFLIDGKVIQLSDSNRKLSFRSRKAESFVNKVKNGTQKKQG